LHDSIQEIFLDIYQRRGKQHIPISNLKAYLFTALKNRIWKTQIQQRKTEVKEIDDSMFSEFRLDYGFQEQMINIEISKAVQLRLQNAIVSLSPGQKEIIYLKFEEELGYPEIAEILSITIESARKQLYRALLSLRHSLDSKTFAALFFLFRKKI
jgi:RNA polymerase sigma factor (sigma-70 family)